MGLDATLALYWTSLGLSAAAVALFLWLMREKRDTGRATRDSDKKTPSSPESRVPNPDS